MLMRAADTLALKLAGAEATREGLLLAADEAKARMVAAEVRACVHVCVQAGRQAHSCAGRLGHAQARLPDLQRRLGRSTRAQETDAPTCRTPPL